VSTDITTILQPPAVLQTTLEVGQGPAGVGTNPAVGVAAEAMSAGTFVNVYSGGVRKASNDHISKEAHGFIVADVAQGATVTVHFAGQNTHWSGVPVGPVYLGLNGAPISTPLNVGPGISQQIGVCVEADVINFTAGLVVVLAGTQP
jgi:hypothetical protein